MSTAPPTAADAKPEKAAKPGRKGGGIMKMLLIVLAFVGGAAAGGFGAVIGVSRLGLAGGGGHAEAAKPAAEAVSPVEYVEIDQAFTSNLIDTGRYLQIRISVSTQGGPAVIGAMGKHKPALVSAILSVLGEMGEADVADRAAKDRLRDRLKDTINATLKENGVVGRIDAVFFTSLVVQ